MTGHPSDSADELARLRDTVAALSAQVEDLRAASPRRRPLRNSATGRSGRVFRRRGIVAAITASAALLAFVGIQAAESSPPPSGYTPIGPVSVLKNKSIAASKSVVAVVVGGKSTVPTAATSVQMDVNVAAGSAAGSVQIYPHGQTPSAGTTITFTAGQTLTQTITVNAGASDEVSATNTSTTTIRVTMTVTAYLAGGAGGPAGGALTGNYPNPNLAANSVNTSNLVDGSVTAGKISASGGTAGQVLTNNGTAATWATPTVPGWQVVQSSSFTNPPNTQSFGSVSCPAGKVVLGGGAVTSATAPGQQAINSLEPVSGTGWGAYIDNVTAISRSFSVYAICGAGS